MSHKSPLFVSALELVVHATELYAQATPRKHKFVVLHLANAVELILKDRVLMAGVSIYKSGEPKTINIWTAFELLEGKGIKVAERPDIELLVDDRNTLQHRFGFPDAATVYYYLEHVIAFFKRFLDTEYNVDLVIELRHYLSEEDIGLLELIIERDEAAYLPKLFQISPEAAAERLHNVIQTEILEIIEPHAIRPLPRIICILETLKHLEQERWLSEGATDRFSAYEPPESDEEFENAMQLLLELRKVRQHNHIPEIEGITTEPCPNTDKSQDNDEPASSQAVP